MANKNNVKKEEKVIEELADENIDPVVLNDWVTEIFGLNPTIEDFDYASSFVKDIIKNTEKEPNYLKLLANLAVSIERSKFVGKLLSYIFKTVVPSDSKSAIYKTEGLEFDHKLILAELEDTVKELEQLKEKIRE
jgi:hypothetical protein